MFPHFVVFGEEHITSADQKITELSFHVDDAANLFYDLDAFGKVIDARSHMERIVEAKKENGRDIAIRGSMPFRVEFDFTTYGC